MAQAKSSFSLSSSCATTVKKELQQRLAELEAEQQCAEQGKVRAAEMAQVAIVHEDHLRSNKVQLARLEEEQHKRGVQILTQRFRRDVEKRTLVETKTGFPSSMEVLSEKRRDVYVNRGYPARSVAINCDPKVAPSLSASAVHDPLINGDDIIAQRNQLRKEQMDALAFEEEERQRKVRESIRPQSAMARLDAASAAETYRQKLDYVSSDQYIIDVATALEKEQRERDMVAKNKNNRPATTAAVVRRNAGSTGRLLRPGTSAHRLLPPTSTQKKNSSRSDHIIRPGSASAVSNKKRGGSSSSANSSRSPSRTNNTYSGRVDAAYAVRNVTLDDFQDGSIIPTTHSLQLKKELLTQQQQEKEKEEMGQQQEEGAAVGMPPSTAVSVLPPTPSHILRPSSASGLARLAKEEEKIFGGKDSDDALEGSCSSSRSSRASSVSASRPLSATAKEHRKLKQRRTKQRAYFTAAQHRLQQLEEEVENNVPAKSDMQILREKRLEKEKMAEATRRHKNNNVVVVEESPIGANKAAVDDIGKEMEEEEETNDEQQQQSSLDEQARNLKFAANEIGTEWRKLQREVLNPLQEDLSKLHENLLSLKSGDDWALLLNEEEILESINALSQQAVANSDDLDNTAAKFKIYDIAATSIQAIARGFLARRQRKRMMLDRIGEEIALDEHEAAVIIQRCYKAHQAHLMALMRMAKHTPPPEEENQEAY